MPRRWSGTLATQTADFRGTSTVMVTRTEGYPLFRHITDARYSAIVSGGVSGAFAVIVNGILGTTTYAIAGLTNITTATNRILFPVGYTSTTGAAVFPGGSFADTEFHRLDLICPPYSVQFQSGIATAGVSVAVTVQAIIVGDD